MQAFLGRYYYCNKYDKPYDHEDNHRYNTRTDVCKLCKKPLHSEKKNFVKIAIVIFFNHDCFNNHNYV